jgi:hypothetical protein
MKPPPFLVGAGLLFWGFEADWLAFAAVMAVLLEAAPRIRSRWEFSDADLNRIWDLCAVLFVGALIIRYTSEEKTITSAYQFFQWFPLLFFPMALAQAYGNRDKIPLTVFSWFLRMRQSKSNRPSPAFHVAYAYFAVCLVSAGAANRRDIWFFAGISILCGCALWSSRSKRFPAPVWAASFAATVLMAFYGQMGLHRLQDGLEGTISSWVARFTNRGFDVNESRTALGSVGMRKQSGRIVMRVRPETGPLNPLLRQASYDSFRETVWLAARNQFAQVSAEFDTTTWVLQPRTNQQNSLMVFTSLHGRAGSLSLPLGASRVEKLAVATMETNTLGAVRVTEAPGLMGYGVRYGGDGSFDVPPDQEADLQVPEKERSVLKGIAQQLGLEQMSPGDKIAAIRIFFQKNFSYSLFVPENLHHPTASGTPLSRFLLQTKKGHCEYFATATVLLLRATKTPARYATGYSVQEPSRGGSTYIVRNRHAHAWTLVWIDDHWEDLDTTPGSWMAEEETQASAFEAISDFFSGLRFQFLKWRWLSGRGWLQQIGPWLLAPLALLLAWRLFVGRKRARHDATNHQPLHEQWPGMDSEFYRIVQQLTVTLGERPAGLSLAQWLEHLRNGPLDKNGVDDLRALLQLHYRHRFDPAGLTASERENLRSGVVLWLQRRRA